MSKAIVIDTPAGIEGFRLCALKSALKLEMIGLRNSRGPVSPIIRQTIGSKTKDKGKLLQELVDYIDDFNNAHFEDSDAKR